MFDASIEIYYWVYILQKETVSEYSIGYATDLPPMTKSVKLVYTRRFQYPLEALGHKLFLENISKASLKRIIKNNMMKEKEFEIQ